MSERRFYCDSLQPGVVSLSPDEAHHARNVVRVRSGDRVRLFDGRGSQAHATIETVGRNGVQAFVEQVESPADSDRPTPVTIAVAMPKAARQDFLIEKCTELGAAAIWPIITQRSVVKPKPSRLDHWRRVAIAAAKQSGQVFLPEIAPPDWFAQILPRVSGFDLRMFASTRRQAQPLSSCLSSRPSDGSILLVIGPEGGFTTEEQASLVDAGTMAVSLGRWTLRTETAAVAALAVLTSWQLRTQ